MGGGISSAIARALGADRRADAEALVVHALTIAVGFGLLFMLAVLGGGHWLYSAMGGSGASLAAALTYSNVLFSGAILIWVFNSLASVIRGTGNMAVPAVVTFAGALVLIPLSPCLIFGRPFAPIGCGSTRSESRHSAPSSIRSRSISTRKPRATRYSVGWPLAVGTPPRSQCGYLSKATSNPPAASWASARTSSAGHGQCGLEMSCGPRARSSRCGPRDHVQIRD